MSLSSLIVQREVATMRQVEEALARQVIYGGDFVTNLLEVARIEESVLVPLLAQTMDLPAGPHGELPIAQERVRALVPPEMAVQRALVPLALEGDRLVLAVGEPLPKEVVDQLAFALGLTVEQRASTLVRVKQAVSRIYGVPLERRMQRLLARLSGEVTATGSMPPPLGAAPAVTEAPRPPSAPPPRATSRSFPAAKAGSVPPQGRPSSRQSLRATSDSEPPSQQMTAPRRTGLVQREGTAARSARRRRGPVTFEVGTAEAEEATDRDALLDLFFNFGRQFFDYASIFVVHGDIAEGRDAFGTGAGRERVVGIGVPLDLPGLMSQSRDKRSTVVAKPTADGLEAQMLADLSRPRDAEIAIVPLVVRTRAVALLVGDCSEQGIDRSTVAQVARFAGVVGKAFERIIVRRKLEGFIAGSRGTGAGRVDAEQAPFTKPSAPPPAQPPAPAPEPPRTVTAPILPALTPAPVVAVSTRPVSATPQLSEPFTHAPSAPQLPSPEPIVPLPIITPTAPPTTGFVPDVRTSPGPPPVVVQPASPKPPPAERVSRTSVPPLVSTSAPPPPPFNIGTLRPIAGPPIPREEPESPMRTPVSRPAPPPTSAPVSAPPPTRADAPVARARQNSAPEIVASEVEEASGLFDELGWDHGTEAPEEQPPPSAAIAVPLHPPAHRIAPKEQLPSIIVDVDDDVASLIGKVVAGDADGAAEGELLRMGERAMRMIMAQFPGPTTYDRMRLATAANPPKVTDCGPVLRLVARQRKVALPFVLDKMAEADPDVRGWATYLVTELPYLDALPHLLVRMQDVDGAVRAAAAFAVAAVSRVYPDETRGMVETLARAPDPHERAASMRAMAELREPAVVPELIRGLADGDETVVAAAQAALVIVTRQDLGNDARRWMKWWESNAPRHRIEWLIDSLSHEVSEIRRAAGDELKALTKEYFGYAPDLPPRDRERAQQRYRDWWITEGKARFRRKA